MGHFWYFDEVSAILQALHIRALLSRSSGRWNLIVAHGIYGDSRASEMREHVRSSTALHDLEKSGRLQVLTRRVSMTCPGIAYSVPHKKFDSGKIRILILDLYAACSIPLHTSVFLKNTGSYKLISGPWHDSFHAVHVKITLREKGHTRLGETNGVIFTPARVSRALLSPRKNGDYS